MSGFRCHQTTFHPTFRDHPRCPWSNHPIHLYQICRMLGTPGRRTTVGFFSRINSLLGFGCPNGGVFCCSVILCTVSCCFFRKDYGNSIIFRMNIRMDDKNWSTPSFLWPENGDESVISSKGVLFRKRVKRVCFKVVGLRIHQFSTKMVCWVVLGSLILRHTRNFGCPTDSHITGTLFLPNSSIGSQKNISWGHLKEGCREHSNTRPPKSAVKSYQILCCLHFETTWSL